MLHFVKKLVSLASAAAIAVSMMSVNAFAAEENSNQSLIMIDGYECFKGEDGLYHTIIDGERYTIFTDDDLVYDEVEDNTTYSTYNAPNYDVDLSTGATYHEYVDLTNGDYVSPVFKIAFPSNSTFNLTIKAGFWLPTSFKIKVEFYVDPIDKWMNNDPKIYTFHLFAQEQFILSHTLIKDSSRAKITIFADGAGTDKFDCYFYQKTQS